MLNPKYQRYASRIRELIQEGEKVVAIRGFSTRVGGAVSGEDISVLHAWLVRVSNIVEAVFGLESSHFRHLKELMPGGVLNIYRSSDIHPIIGLLTGALDDLEKGYLLGQEFIIASEVFDSVLEQAKYLRQTGYKDPAAVLARVVLEDALKRLARVEDIDDTQKASKINEELKKAGRYAQPQWRLIQAWLDIGNAAAHGKFGEYTDEDVEKLIEDIERFLAAEFRT